MCCLSVPAFFTPETAESREANESFEGWLTDFCVNTDYPEEQRRSMLEGGAGRQALVSVILEKSICCRYMCVTA